MLVHCRVEQPRPGFFSAPLLRMPVLRQNPLLGDGHAEPVWGALDQASLENYGQGFQAAKDEVITPREIFQPALGKKGRLEL